VQRRLDVSRDERPPPLTTISKSPYSGSRDQDDSSVASTSLDSVFSTNSSTNSTGTSNTALSKESGFSVEQIETATRAFVSLVQSDQVLRPLYENARNDPSSGASRLQIYVRATLKEYAENLRKEAKDHLEFSASQLVRSKAGHAARCVANDSNSVQQSTKDVEESSDDEAQERPIDERQFNDDLDTFRSFLTQSKAFAKLRDQTKNIFSPQPDPPAADTNVQEDVQSHPEIGTLGARLMCLSKETTMTMMANLLMSMGFLERPSKTGCTRIIVDCHVSRHLPSLHQQSLIMTLDLR